MAYKVLKHFNRTNKDTIEINNIEDLKKWIKHYKNLWCTNSPQNDDEPEATSTPSAGIDK